MANEPTQGAGVRQTGSNGLAGMRTAGVRPCPSCNTSINVHATVCPACGEHVAVKEKAIRCRRCRQRASSSLVVCPHCGRDLYPAPTRWLTWGIPLLVLLLLAGLLLVQLGRNDPQQWAARQGERVAGLVESLGSRLQPQFSVASIPPGQNPDDPLVAQAAQMDQQAGLTLNNPTDLLPVAPRPDAAAAGTETVADPPADVAGATPPAQDAEAAQEAPIVQAAPATAPAATEEPVMTATAAPTATPVATATATAPPPTPTATAQPTSVATAPATDSAIALAIADATAPAITTSTANVSATQVTNGTTPTTRIGAARTPSSTRAANVTPAATATPSQTVSLLGLLTPTPVPPLAPTVTPTTAPAPAVLAVYEVRPGDTLFDIARQYDMTVDDLLGANNLTADDVYTIQPGDELNIPAPTPAGGPTATPGPAPATYTVRTGDTVLAIALRLDLTMDELLAANNLTINDARGLQPGDVLTLPTTEPAVQPTTVAASTPAPAATATATAASPTTAPASAVRADAPRLRSPENATSVSCDSQGTLNWQAVPNMRPSDIYVVHLGYVNAIAANDAEEIIWVISQQQPAGSTSWALDNDLCGLAPVTEGKQWRWYVEVAEKGADGLQPVSPASPVWGFAWQ